MIERFIESLQDAGLVLSDQELGALSEAQSLLHDEDIADVLWLVAQMGGEPGPERSDNVDDEIQEEGLGASTESIEIDTDPAELSPPAPVIPAYVQDSKKPSEDGELDTSDSGLPLQVQAAPALPNTCEMGRSLRPLMRKAPSRTQQVLDELATVDRIAQEDVWIPVLKPAPERWFDLELVIESSPFGFVWASTLAEFQSMLEQQGAFRNVRTWLVEEASGEPKLVPKTKVRSRAQPLDSLTNAVTMARSPRELIDASGRALVLYVSDCRSSLWQHGKIHDWLKLWSQHGPTTVVQLLPERLWSQTALNVGFKVQVSAFTPGVANPKMQVHNPPARRGLSAENTLTVPVVTLTASALRQWARIIAAAGQQRLPARLFDMAWVGDEDRIAEADWDVIDPQTPEDRLELFNATASPMAKRLARLMSEAPLELPVVHLIQKSFFKDAADPVHVAEVYDSCLIEPTGSSKAGEEPRYKFVDGVRELLNKANPIDETLDVLDVLSKEIARTLGFEINSFTALLYPNAEWGEKEKAAILPFAQIATQVLQRLGGQYAELAQQVEQDAARRQDDQLSTPEPDLPEPIFPELRSLEFIKAELIDAAARAEARRVNDAGLEIIKAYEGLSINAFQDADGVWMIGYGHTSEAGAPEVEPGMQITENEAETILKQDLRQFERVVENAVTIETNDNQFSAMVSFVYNVGESAYLDSDLLRKHNAGDFSGVAEEFMRWMYVEGQALPGLQRRRTDEQALYLSTDTTEPAVELITDEFTIATINIEPGELEAENERSELERFEFVVARIVRRQAEADQLQAESTLEVGADSQWVIQRQRRSAYRFVEVLTNASGLSFFAGIAKRLGFQNDAASLKLEMVAISGGTFTMGSPDNEPARYSNEGPQHEVTLQPFFMGRYPITQAQWRFVASLEQVNRGLDPNPSRFKGDRRPVESVTWYEAVEFCERLSRHTGREYRLPTEAEWEYACRAGTETPFHFGETISSELANYLGTTTYADGPKGEERGETTPIDQFGVANAFGLSDMHGNVREWCLDHWHGNYEGPPKDGSAWLTENESANRIWRGGSWYSYPRYCRSASRTFYRPGDRYYDVGFRVVCVAPGTLTSNK